MLLHKGVVDIGVGGGDDHHVGALYQLGGEGGLAYVLLAVVTETGNVGVEEDDVGTLVTQLVDDADGGRLTVVVDVVLIGHTEYEDARAVDGLAETAVEHVGHTVHAVFGHAVVDHHGGLNHRGMETVLTGFPTEVVGVEWDAVTAQTGTGIEGGEAEGLGLGGFDDLPEVDVHAVAQDGELIDEADVDVAVGVLENLGHLGHGGGGGAEHAVLQEGLVHGADYVAGVGTETAHHLGGVLGLEIGVARIDTLRRETEVEVLAALETALLEDGLEELFGGAGVGGALEHDHHALVEILGYLTGGRLDIADVGLLMGVEGGGHADGDEVDAAELTEVGGGTEHTFAHQAGEVAVDDVADIVVSFIDEIDFLLLHIEADGLEAGFGFFDGEGEAYVAESDHAGDDFLVGDFLKNLFFHF